MENNTLKILAIDDNPDNLITVKALIGEAFPEAVVFTALDGQKGIEITRREDPDVILLDIIMPDMDGFEVCRKLKADIITADIPVVFLTAIKGDKESRIKALESGAEAFMAKPIDESELTAQIRTMVKIKKSIIRNRDEKAHLEFLVEEKMRELRATYTATLNLLEDLKRENDARKESEKMLQQSEQNYRTIVESGQTLVWSSGPDGMCDYFNAIWYEFTGRDFEEEKGKGWINGLHPDDVQDRMLVFMDSFRNRVKFSIEYRLRRHDGTYRWIQDNGSPRYNTEGVFIGYIGHCFDIQERKETENALKYEQYLMSTLMNNIPTRIYFKDRKSKFIRINLEQAKAFSLQSCDEAIGKTDFDFFTKEHAQQAFEDEQEIMQTGKLITLEEKETWENKSDTWVLTSKMPFLDTNGEIIGTFGISSDITERKKAEAKINTLLAEKELILKEVHHRIKNNMNTIYGLLVLQAGALEDSRAKAILEDAGNRVRSMMLLYTKLYQTLDFTEISVARYLPFLIDEIMANFPNAENVQVKKHINDFILDTKKLQPLGIIINELLTNIMKYAFVGKTNGQVSIYVTLKNGIVSVILTDNGNGMPDFVDFEHSTGFGLVLVGGLTDQLGGSIRIERGKGTSIILEFPK